MCAESEKILAQDGPAAENLKLPDIFGATEDDASSLRIVSLYEVSPAPLLCSYLYRNRPCHRARNCTGHRWLLPELSGSLLGQI